MSKLSNKMDSYEEFKEISHKFKLSLTHQDKHCKGSIRSRKGKFYHGDFFDYGFEIRKDLVKRIRSKRNSYVDNMKYTANDDNLIPCRSHLHSFKDNKDSVKSINLGIKLSNKYIKLLEELCYPDPNIPIYSRDKKKYKRRKRKPIIIHNFRNQHENDLLLYDGVSVKYARDHNGRMRYHNNYRDRYSMF